VLQATADALADHGYERLAIEDIAQRAGVHPTTVYRRWGGKADLVLDAMRARSEAVVELPGDGPLDDALLTFLRSVAANVASPLGRALVAATLRAEPEGAEAAGVRHRFWEERFALARRRLDRAQREHDLPAGADTELALEAMISPIFFRTLVRGEPVDDRYLRQLVRLATGQPTRAPRT
jgi:AcrR family transcriptional regulator